MSVRRQPSRRAAPSSPAGWTRTTSRSGCARIHEFNDVVRGDALAWSSGPIRLGRDLGCLLPRITPARCWPISCQGSNRCGSDLAPPAPAADDPRRVGAHRALNRRSSSFFSEIATSQKSRCTSRLTGVGFLRKPGVHPILVRCLIRECGAMITISSRRDSVVCGVDASAHAAAVVAFAVHLSDRLGLRLRLVHSPSPDVFSWEHGDVTRWRGERHCWRRLARIAATTTSFKSAIRHTCSLRYLTMERPLGSSAPAAEDRRGQRCLAVSRASLRAAPRARSSSCHLMHRLI
jgi:hypothetical protein